MTTYCTRVHVPVYVRRDRYSSCGHRCQVDGTLVISERRRCVSVCGSSFCDVYIRESHIIAVCEARTHHLATKAKDNTGTKRPRELTIVVASLSPGSLLV